MKTFQPTILVVEDDPDDCLLYGLGFEKSGISCPLQSVSTGTEAISYLMGEGKYSDRQQFPFPSLILTDLNMPGGDGFHLLEHLKLNPDWAFIPRIVFTSSEDPDDIKKAYMLGASSYHVKPSDFAGLCAQLKVLYEYWITSKVPQVDITGRQLMTDSGGKLGERYSQSTQSGASTEAKKTTDGQ